MQNLQYDNWLSYCKFCIYTHPVYSKFTIWQCSVIGYAIYARPLTVFYVITVKATYLISFTSPKFWPWLWPLWKSWKNWTVCVWIWERTCRRPGFASNKDTVVFHKMGKKGVAILGLILMAIKQSFMFLIWITKKVLQLHHILLFFKWYHMLPNQKVWPKLFYLRIN